jgi:hypothetical protein
MSNLINFKNAIIGTGGASYNILTGEFNPKQGFMVSIEGHEEISKFNPNNLQYTIARYVRTKADLILSGENQELFLGAWVDGEDLVLDVSVHIESRAEAIRVGIANEQIAYYDCNLGESIEL